MDKMTTGPSSKKIWILLGLVVIIIIITIIAASSNQTKTAKQSNQATPTAKTTSPSVSPGEAVVKNQVELAKENIPSLKDARQDIPSGVNLITKEDKVVNLQGETVRTNVPMTSPEAPQQTGPLSKDNLSSKVIKLEMSLAKGIVPTEFTVARGAAISIAVSSVDEWTHIFKFEDPALSSVAIGVSTGETRGMTFNAPTKAGEYKFYCDLPGHASRGEVGKMIVK